MTKKKTSKKKKKTAAGAPAIGGVARGDRVIVDVVMRRSSDGAEVLSATYGADASTEGLHVIAGLLGGFGLMLIHGSAELARVRAIE